MAAAWMRSWQSCGTSYSRAAPSSVRPKPSARRTHDVGFQHRIHQTVRRRRDAKLKAEFGDLAAEPGQLQPVAALEVERHRRLHGRRRVAVEFKYPGERIWRQYHAFGAADIDHFLVGCDEDRTHVRIVPQLAD